MPQITLMMGKLEYSSMVYGLDKLGRGMKRNELRESGQQNCGDSSRRSRRNVLRKRQRRYEKDKQRSRNVNKLKPESGSRLVTVRARHGRANILSLASHIETLTEIT